MDIYVDKINLLIAGDKSSSIFDEAVLSLERNDRLKRIV